MTHQSFDASITPSTASANESEGKRNRKTQLLSALLSASALGLFLEGCDFGLGSRFSATRGGITGSGDSESDPEIATAKADLFEGDWVSYERSTAGVTIDLDIYKKDERASGGWAEGDVIQGYYTNIIGSDHADTLNASRNDISLKGGKGNDILSGGRSFAEITLIFNPGDGTDRIINENSRGSTKLVFEQGANDAYEGATYNFAYVKGILTLTVREGGETLNTIEIAYPRITSGIIEGVRVNRFSDFEFYTRKDGSETEILTDPLSLPTIRGSKHDPHVATSEADTFYGNEGFYNWVSYAGSTAGVNIDLSNDVPTASGGWAAGDTLISIESLIGSRFDDILIGDSGDNALKGGNGDDLLVGGSLLYGEGGADTYRFDAVGGTAQVFSSDDGTGNKLVFRAPQGVTYTDANFAFIKRDDDLRIVVSAGGDTKKTVVIEDYFDQPDDAYTIYRTGYNSNSDGTIVSTAPAETS